MRLCVARILQLKYLCVLICFFFLGVNGQVNDNSAFVLAVGTPNNKIEKPKGCNAKFWLSTGQQIPLNNGSILNDNEWWWEDVSGNPITTGETLGNDGQVKYESNHQRENKWDLEGTPTYSGIHYFLEIRDIRAADYGTYRFVVKKEDGSGTLGVDSETRYEEFILEEADDDVYCSNPIAFGARKGYIKDNIGGAAWTSYGDTNSVEEHIFMVGPFTPTTGNPRERFQITSLDINAKYSARVGQCERFGYNFKVQIFDVDPVSLTATCVQQQDLLFPLDALLAKYGSKFSDKDSYYPFPGTGVDPNDPLLYTDWTHIQIPVWYARGPLLIGKGQYIGISTEGCITLKRGDPLAYTNVPNQKSFYSPGAVVPWTYATLVQGVSKNFFTARPALLNDQIAIKKTVGEGPYSFAFNAEFYDIKSVRVDPTRAPIVEDTSAQTALIVLLVLLLICLCFSFCICFIAEKNHKSTKERRRYMMSQMLNQCNICSETGEPLPPGWFEEKSPSGDYYYYNPDTKESMWDIPVFG